MKKNIFKNLFLVGSVVLLGLSQLDAAPVPSYYSNYYNLRTQNQRGAQISAMRSRAAVDGRSRLEIARNYYTKPEFGLILGAGGGAGMITRSVDLGDYVGRQSNDYSLGIGYYWEVRLGWQQYFTRMYGFRAYINYDQTWAFPGQLSTLGLKAMSREYVLMDRILANVDYLWDVIAEGKRRVGVYIGIYGGWAEVNQKYKKTGTSNMSGSGSSASIAVEEELEGSNYSNAWVVGINAGVSITLAKRNRFEIGAKVPILDIISKEYYEVSTSSTNAYEKLDTSWKTPVFSIGYHFIF